MRSNTLDLTRFLLAVPPVFVFLGVLSLLDSYRLTTLRQILRAVAWGVAAACFCYFVDSRPDLHARFVTPTLEELCKAAYVIWLVRTARVGFVVDAAICGFAVGAGFALVENLYYIQTLSNSSLAVWIVRGFGTAMMHGGTTAILAVVAEGAPDHAWLRITCGLLLSASIHAAWNMALVTPLEASLVVLVGLPLLFVPIFIYSERSLHRWMGDRLDRDLELLSMISSGEFSETGAGHYLYSLQAAFPPPVRQQMLDILRLSADLSGSSKGNMIRRAAGIGELADPDAGRKLQELRELEKQLGRSGRRALAPLRSLTSRDLWEMYKLETSSQSTFSSRQEP